MNSTIGERLDLRRELEASPLQPVEERLLAHAVAGAEEALAVPDREREHAVEAREAGGPHCR